MRRWISSVLEVDEHHRGIFNRFILVHWSNIYNVRPDMVNEITLPGVFYAMLKNQLGVYS